jgi:hypothetical protein
MIGVIDELEVMWKKVCVTYSRHLSGGTEQNHESPQPR